MAYIVKCPQCNEINAGSQLHCVKCQTSLIEIPREQGESPIPEFVSPPPTPENHQARPLLKNKTKTIVSKISIIVYSLTALFALIKLLLQQAESYTELLRFTAVAFLVGLMIYVSSAETLLRFGRDTGYLLSKLGPFENSGFDRASTFYTFVGLTIMIIAIAINIVALFTQ